MTTSTSAGALTSSNFNPSGSWIAVNSPGGELGLFDGGAMPPTFLWEFKAKHPNQVSPYEQTTLASLIVRALDGMSEGGPCLQ